MILQSSEAALVRRYLLGLIKNKGTTAGNWITEEHCSTSFDKYVLGTLQSMHRQNARMSLPLVLDRLISGSPDASFTDPIRALVYESETVDVSPDELGDLKDAIHRSYVSKESQKVLDSVLHNINRPGAIDIAIEALRLLKSAEPTIMTSLDKQIDAAIDEAINGHAGLIPYGIPTLDRKLAGVNRCEVTVCAGRPGMGKTSFSLQLAINWLRQGFKVMIISKEMTASKLIHKLVVNQCDAITSDKMKRGDLGPEDMVQLNVAIKNMKDSWKDQLIIIDNLKTWYGVEALIAKHRPDVVIDDFIQMTAFDTPDTRAEITNLLKAYKWMAKEYNLGFWVLSQINREVAKREDGRPRMTDLSEADTIGHYASEILFIHYPHAINHNEDPNMVEILIDKARYGERGGCLLHFDGSHMRYSEIPRLN